MISTSDSAALRGGLYLSDRVEFLSGQDELGFVPEPASAFDNAALRDEGGSFDGPSTGAREQLSQSTLMEYQRAPAVSPFVSAPSALDDQVYVLTFHFM